MGHRGIQMWTWVLFVSLSWMDRGQASEGPQYMVPIPAILEAGTQAKFCASLLQPNESLTMTVSLRSTEMNSTLLQTMLENEYHTCSEFAVPLVTKDEVWEFEVEVKGNMFYSKEVRKVKIIVRKPVTFIQTDKPLYLPGQTVHFRVVTLDSHLKPDFVKYDKIELEDSNNNLIGQWLHDTSDGKILQRSYELNAEAKQGGYSIIVTSGQEKKYHNFKVEKYVLPKFEVKINTPEEISIDQDQITAKICAEYTYKQPVPGNMKLDVCRPLQRHYGYSSQELDAQQVTAPCYKEIKETDNEGCVTINIPMSTFTKLDKKILQDVLEVSAKMQEQGTGIEQSDNQRIGISYVIGKVSFIDTPKIYEKGSNLEGKVQAVDENNVPIPDMPVYLFEGETWSSRHLQNLTTDQNGVAAFTLDTSIYSGDISLHVSTEPSLGYSKYREPHFENGQITVSMAQESSVDTKTVSFLKVKKVEGPLKCHTDVSFSIQYTVVKEPQSSMDVMYLVLSRDGIFLHKVAKVELMENTANEGEVTFDLNMDPELVPEFRIVAYAILPSGFVIAHEAEFTAEKCFAHKVSLEFSPSSAVPGEEAALQVTAHPQSLCGISAVDKSVLIKEPGKTLDADRIFNLLDRKWYVPYDAVDEVECISVRPKRYIMPYQPEGDDPYTVFKNVGLKMATNLFIRVPNCLKFMGRQYYQGHNYGPPMIARMDTVQLVGSSGHGFGGAPPPIETARSFFPETWIWDLVEVGASGTQALSVTAPDTITTWETEAFCLSPQGFGLAPRKEFSVFQPFFLELSLPYSVIRGENFELKATVFNYVTSCFTVTVTPSQSSDYILTLLSGNQLSFCLCGKQRRTISWTMAPSALGAINVTMKAEASGLDTSCSNDVVPERGRIDMVTKSLIVKAEGVEKTDTYNWLLCPKGASLTEEVNVNLPKDVIDGSARASVSVLGDILGRALQNLDGMLEMPYGCGEQNMGKLSPNIYILQYLSNTNQQIKEKAIHFLTSGYQRQLNYKHSDGAYSTFGTGDGNTWLTAFVLRSFAKAQTFIFIDPSVMEQSKTWLQGKQRENGCFQQVGKLFNNRMKGGVSDDVTLSAYITAAMLEMNVSADSPVVRNSLSCLKESMKDLTNTYTTALMAYVFTLAGDTEARTLLLGHLDKVAVSQGGFLHWSQTAEDTSASLSVEISSYVLLAKLSASPSTEDLGYAAKIVRWLTTQQNYYGGFSSTQDTVVALQALALYSTLVFSPVGSSTVTVRAPSTELTLDVNQNNKLLYQERLLQDVEGQYSVEVRGTACAVIQLSTHYNIPTPKSDKILSVELQAVSNCDGNSVRPTMILKMKSQYNGKYPTTNMIILDIKVLSGFSVDAESLKRLKGTPLVDRVEQKEDHIIVYLEELPKDLPIHHEVVLVRELPVNNLKPAVVRIYDYYRPSEEDKTEYTFPCV